MTLRALCALAALLATCFATAMPAQAGERQPQRRKPLAAESGEARVIVQFKPGAGAVRAHALSAAADREAVATTLQRRADALGARRGIALASGRGISEHMQVVRATGVDSATLARLLAADPEVENAWVDQRRRHSAVPNDPRFAPVLGTSPASGQWYLKTPDAITPASINAVNAWDVSVGSTSMVVAVLDTGVRFDHEDLASKLLTGRDMVSDLAISNDGNGRDGDASDPGDYVKASEAGAAPFQNCDEAPSSWHGTTVAGIIGAATNNGIGMAGVAWNVKILPVRVLGKCFGHDSDIEAGMRWAAGLNVPGEPPNPTPARVINLSLGGAGLCGSYGSAVNDVMAAGAVVVAAAGNANGLATEAPGNCPGVIAVAGVRHAGSKVDYSNIGTEVALAAPAGNCVNETGACVYPILGTTNPGTTDPVAGSAGSTYTDGFNPSMGTSFSAPLVAGTAALMLSVNPALTPAQLRSLLRSTARSFPTFGGSPGIGVCQPPSTTEQKECYCTTSTCGAGMLDAAAAVQAAAALVPPAPSGLQAAITQSPASVTAGGTVLLSAETSTVGTGRSIVSYAWSLVSGTGSFVGAVNTSTATFAATSAGTVTVRLTIVDDAGNTSTVDRPISVAAPAAPSNGTETGGGGGGGGAMSAAWLLALALAVRALAAPRRRV